MSNAYQEYIQHLVSKMEPPETVSQEIMDELLRVGMAVLEIRSDGQINHVLPADVWKKALEDAE